jgi:hypothetical protein
MISWAANGTPIRLPFGASPAENTRETVTYGTNPMKPILRFAIWGAMTAITFTAATGSAHASSPYDGSWYVIITTVRGACSSGSGFSLQIRDGAVYGDGGGFNLGGRVSRSGAVHVSVSSGQQQASGSGTGDGAQGAIVRMA